MFLLFFILSFRLPKFTKYKISNWRIYVQYLEMISTFSHWNVWNVERNFWMEMIGDEPTNQFISNIFSLIFLSQISSFHLPESKFWFLTKKRFSHENIFHMKGLYVFEIQKFENTPKNNKFLFVDILGFVLNLIVTRSKFGKVLYMKLIELFCSWRIDS